MIRIIPFILEIFALPYIAYTVWLLATRRNPLTRAAWVGVPWQWFGVFSCLVILGVLLFGRQLERDTGTRGYTPAYIENGKLVPPRVQ